MQQTKVLVAEADDGLASQIFETLRPFSSEFVLHRVVDLNDVILALNDHHILLLDFHLDAAESAPDNVLKTICEIVGGDDAPVIVGLVGDDDLHLAAQALRDCAQLFVFKNDLKGPSGLLRALRNARKSLRLGVEMPYSIPREALRLLRHADPEMLARQPNAAIEILFSDIGNKLDLLVDGQRDMKAIVAGITQRLVAVENDGRTQHAAISQLERRIHVYDELFDGDVKSGRRPLSIRVVDLESEIVRAKTDANQRGQTFREILVGVIPVVLGGLFTAIGTLLGLVYANKYAGEARQAVTPPAHQVAPEQP